MLNKHEGWIYKRTLISPKAVGTDDNGKSYIGQTENMKVRNQNWNKPNSTSYGGSKITEARNKYGVGEDAWKTDILERVFADTRDELKQKLREGETRYIHKFNSVEHGFNRSYGTGMQGAKHTDASRQLISENHRHYNTEETKQKISKKLKGYVFSEERNRKLSISLKGKKRTPEMRAAQSARMKGKEPVAASKALKKYIEEHGHGPTKGIKQSEATKAKMKAIQQARGTKVTAIYPDGHTEDFNTMLDAAKNCGLNVGSVASVLKTQGQCKNGMRFRQAS